jgi:sugar-specific transcriptional regulator TrmB
MSVNGIGTYGAAYYQSMYRANTSKNLISGLKSSVSSSSDPMSSLYNTLKDSALYKTTGYRSLVKSYYAQKSEEVSEKVSESADSLKNAKTAEDTEDAVQKAKETLSNITYNASGVAFSENAASSGTILNMQI